MREEKSTRKRGDAEVRGRKRSFFTANIFSSFDPRVAAPSVRFFLLWLSNKMKPTQNASEPKKYLQTLFQRVVYGRAHARLSFSQRIGREHLWRHAVGVFGHPGRSLKIDHDPTQAIGGTHEQIAPFGRL